MTDAMNGQCSKHRRYSGKCLECIEAREKLLSSTPVTVPKVLSARQADDLIRCVGVIALSGNPLPPKMVGDRLVQQTGYTARQHRFCVERCLHLMNEHNLWEWNATTVELAQKRPIVRRQRRHSP